MSGSGKSAVAERFFGSLRDKRESWPEWLLLIDEPDDEEHRMGADAVAVTAERRILIHLEDSREGLQKFNFMHPENKMLVLLIFNDFTPMSIVAKSLDFIERERSDPRASRRS